MMDFLVGLGVALLSGMGVGSGGLLVVYLTLIRNTAQLQAQGINLFFFLFSSSASCAVNLRRRNIAWGQVTVLGISGAAAAICGSLLAAVINPTLMRRLFGLMLLASGAPGLLSSLRDMFTKRQGRREKE